MKLTKRQIRKIVREEKAKLNESRMVGSLGFGSNLDRASTLFEQPISPEQGEQMQMEKDWKNALDYFSSGAGMMQKFATSQSSPYSTATQWGQGNEANDLADVLQEIWESAGFDPREIFK